MRPFPSENPLSAAGAGERPLFIVFNLGSGHGDAAQARAAIEQAAREAGREAVVMDVPDPAKLGDTVREAVSCAIDRAGIVVAAGGDGTINCVAQAALASGCTMGVLPQGTFNYFSRAHGIPADTAQAMQVLLHAQAQPVQVGLLNDKVFLVNASLGLYPQLLEDREAYKQQYGRSRGVALWSGLATLMREHRQLRLRMDHHRQSQTIRTPTLVVCNNPLQLLQIGIPEAPALEAGQLAAITLQPVGSLALLWLLLRGLLGRLGDAERVASFAFRTMRVHTALPYGPRRVKVATDGEVSWLSMPLEFRVSPEPLMLIKPAHAPELEAARAEAA
jgi:diacylglycerol kinase family enzyme